MPPHRTIHKDLTTGLKKSYKGHIVQQMNANRKAQHLKRITFPEFVKNAKLSIIENNWNDIQNTFDEKEREKDNELTPEQALLEKRAQVHRKAIQSWWDAHKQDYLPQIKQQYTKPISYDDDDSTDEQPDPDPPEVAPNPELHVPVHQNQLAAEEGPLGGEDRAQAQAIVANVPQDNEVKKKRTSKRKGPSRSRNTYSLRSRA